MDQAKVISLQSGRSSCSSPPRDTLLGKRGKGLHPFPQAPFPGRRALRHAWDALALAEKPMLPPPLRGAPWAAIFFGFNRKKFSSLYEKPSSWLFFRSILQAKLLGVGLEPTRFIQPGDFKSPVSTIPPSKQREKDSKTGKKRRQARRGTSAGI